MNELIQPIIFNLLKYCFIIIIIKSLIDNDIWFFRSIFCQIIKTILEIKIDSYGGDDGWMDFIKRNLVTGFGVIDGCEDVCEPMTPEECKQNKKCRNIGDGKCKGVRYISCEDYLYTPECDSGIDKAGASCKWYIPPKGVRNPWLAPVTDFFTTENVKKIREKGVCKKKPSEKCEENDRQLCGLVDKCIYSDGDHFHDINSGCKDINKVDCREFKDDKRECEILERKGKCTWMGEECKAPFSGTTPEKASPEKASP